ncbi:UNVERIFIED_CONTAM: hypothetical protein GTU68_032869 [Idotea baltica]|nr:hypothetical protein [Idotea baltica]
MTFVPSDDETYPFGKQLWTLGRSICGFSRGDQINMTLSACDDGEFTCRDGSCVSLIKKCDLRVDCADGSDEKTCSIIDKEDGYQKIIPPPTPEPPNPLNISFSINIVAFTAINTQQLNFGVAFELQLIWKDIRLTFQNIKKKSSLNRLSSEEVDYIWTPKVFFANSFNSLYSNLDEGTKIEAVPEGDIAISSRTKAEESKIYIIIIYI